MERSTVYKQGGGGEQTQDLLTIVEAVGTTTWAQFVGRNVALGTLAELYSRVWIFVNSIFTSVRKDKIIA